MTALFRAWGLWVMTTLLSLAPLLAPPVAWSNEANPMIETRPKPFSLTASEGDWSVSGTVTNEQGERYPYFFQMHRIGRQFTTITALIDETTQRLLFFDKSVETIEHPDIGHLRVGQAFLKFNSINHNLVFGVNTQDHKGFNFKADMLTKIDHMPSAQNLRAGVELLIDQTGQITGHVHFGGEKADEFVTASKGWLRHIWLTQPQYVTHPLTGILCEFNDGSGFYALNLKENDALRAAVAGWRNDQGLPLPMSQFVSIAERQAGQWHVNVAIPKFSLLIKNILAKDAADEHLIAGITDKTRPGFCAINNIEMGKEAHA